MSMLVNPFAFGGGGGTPPGPETIADLEFWADASQESGFSNGDQMNAVQDWSGNNRDGTGVARGGIKPTFRTTDGPTAGAAFRFGQNSADGGHFSLPDFLTGFSAGHGFAVIKWDSATGESSPPFSTWGSAGDGYYIFEPNDHIYDPFATSVRKDDITPNTAINLWHLYECRSAAGAWSLWQNGVQLHSTGTNTVAFSSAPLIGGTAGRPCIGLSRTMFFYSRILNAGEITSIYDWVEFIDGITLP